MTTSGYNRTLLGIERNVHFEIQKRTSAVFGLNDRFGSIPAIQYDRREWRVSADTGHPNRLLRMSGFRSGSGHSVLSSQVTANDPFETLATLALN